MKKLLLLVVASMFLFGCASLKDPEYRKHNTIYASSSHMTRMPRRRRYQTKKDGGVQKSHISLPGNFSHSVVHMKKAEPSWLCLFN
jgi:hypothetical protein